MSPRNALLVLSGLLGIACSAPTEGASSACDPTIGNILGYKMKSLDEKDISLQTYSGSPLIVTNTAAFWGNLFVQLILFSIKNSDFFASFNNFDENQDKITSEFWPIS